LKKPDEFAEFARLKGALVRNGHGSRLVVRYQGKTIGFSRHANEEYSKRYRLLLVKAFAAAGLVAIGAAVLILEMSLQWLR
jgi:hypothetical protein